MNGGKERRDEEEEIDDEEEKVKTGRRLRGGRNDEYQGKKRAIGVRIRGFWNGIGKIFGERRRRRRRRGRRRRRRRRRKIRRRRTGRTRRTLQPSNNTHVTPVSFFGFFEEKFGTVSYIFSLL